MTNLRDKLLALQYTDDDGIKRALDTHAVEEILNLIPPQEHMWINAFKTVRPSDEFAAEVGHEIIKALRQSQGSDERKSARAEDVFEPIMAVEYRIVAS